MNFPISNTMHVSSYCVTTGVGEGFGNSYFCVTSFINASLHINTFTESVPNYCLDRCVMLRRLLCGNCIQKLFSFRFKL